jgi:CheY-like chemotaxis protein/putative methionine-R-sulfoxide reductase with GAF domain/PAS domain-containing protein
MSACSFVCGRPEEQALSTRPRILIFDGPAYPAGPFLDRCLTDCEVVRAATVGEGLALLRTEQFDGVYANPQDPAIWERAGSLLQSDYILDVLGDGIALVNPDLRITWANTSFEKWCGGPVKGRTFYEALGSPNILGPDYCPFHTALAGKAVTTRLHCRDNLYVELSITPVSDTTGKVSQLISLARDVTALVQQQHKLDALHKVGRELAGLSAEQLDEMSVEDRVELLKHNIRKFAHDTLHYDVVEIRLLNRQTGELEPLLDEGMTEKAAHRVLFAKPEGNGVTGYVAATGKSYLCRDTASDPLYIEGAQGARSSVTVPLTVADQVIGTFNVESPQVEGFNDEDLQFCEIFSRELAAALHTLELLSAEKRTTASQSIEAISREVAMPVDEILTAATAVLDRWIGIEPEMADKLKQILASARMVKQCIQKVGEDMTPRPSALSQSGAIKAHPRLHGLRVLVADNDERVRRSAHSILGGKFGCIVETARDGKEALTMARLGSYDVVLTDIRLPDMTGHDVYCQLKGAQPQARVILMTAFGYDPTHSIVKCRQEGLRHVLYKPFRVDQLLDALESPDGHAAPAAAPGTPSAAPVQA